MEFSQVNSKVWPIGFLTLLCNMHPGRLTKDQLLGVPDHSSRFVFCFNFAHVGGTQGDQTLGASCAVELTHFKSKF